MHTLLAIENRESHFKSKVFDCDNGSEFLNRYPHRYIDDVLNVSGHRIGTAEVEGAIGQANDVTGGRCGWFSTGNQRRSDLCVGNSLDRQIRERRDHKRHQKFCKKNHRPARDSGKNSVHPGLSENPFRKNHAANPEKNR